MHLLIQLFKAQLSGRYFMYRDTNPQLLLLILHTVSSPTHHEKSSVESHIQKRRGLLLEGPEKISHPESRS